MSIAAVVRSTKDFAPTAVCRSQDPIAGDPAQFLRAPRARSNIFRVPEIVLVICLGQSTYARLVGNHRQCHPAGAGLGRATYAGFFETPPRCLRTSYANEGACQVSDSCKGNERCRGQLQGNSAGKYMGQSRGHVAAPVGRGTGAPPAAFPTPPRTELGIASLPDPPHAQIGENTHPLPLSVNRVKLCGNIP